MESKQYLKERDHIAVNTSKISTYDDTETLTEPFQSNTLASNNTDGVDDKDESGNHQGRRTDILYSVDEVPSWYLCCILGLQQFITAMGGLIGGPLLLSKSYCMEGDVEGLTYVIGTTLVACGLSTVLQTTIGVRLPIVQGCTAAFFGPIISVLSQPEWKCLSQNGDVTGNLTSTIALPVLGSNQHKEMWQPRIRMVLALFIISDLAVKTVFLISIQGSMMVSSLFQVAIGCTGLAGRMLRYIGPLTVCPTISLIGLSLYDVVVDFASKQWYIALSTAVIIAICSQFLKNIKFPIFAYKANDGCSVSQKLPIFQLFPVLLAIGISWCICTILTVTDSLPSTEGQWGYEARTDIKTSAIFNSPWFRIPYPGQWGVPTVSAAAVCGMLAAVIVSVVESIGDYRSCARLSGATSIPSHAVNRGIAIEGIGVMLNGAFGSGNATTSYSENVAAILITRVGSRRVVFVAGIIMIALGCFGKCAAVFVAIPDPILGGMFLITVGMIIAVGLSNLQFVDLNSSRNLFIIGTSLFGGLAIPSWIKSNPENINTGSALLNQIIVILLSTNMIVGGLLGFIFDNIIPGTLQERGMLRWNEKDESHVTSRKDLSTYNIPLIQKFINKCAISKWLPICPTFMLKKNNMNSTTESTQHNIV